MLKDLKTAIAKNQTLSIQTKDGNILMGIPKKTGMSAVVKITNEEGVVYVPIADIQHVTRIIKFP
ncbi:hypothetical protein [Paenibacillus sp. FSL M7-0896]|uniref:hypothetical protein n=1 Tax=Paenibacillus sp. FSL M7-0896 TaxID=2921610 RepID=UPI0030DA1E71